MNKRGRYNFSENQQAFSLSMNWKSKDSVGLFGIIDWLLGNKGLYWNAVISRAILENDTTYEEAKYPV